MHPVEAEGRPVRRQRLAGVQLPAQGGQRAGEAGPVDARAGLEAGGCLLVEPRVADEQVLPAAVAGELADGPQDRGRRQVVGRGETAGVGHDGFPADRADGHRQGAGGGVPEPHDELAFLAAAVAGRRGAGGRYCSSAAVSRTTASRCLRVIFSVPSLMASLAASWMSWSRLPIMPPVRWCRYSAWRSRVPGLWRCRRSEASMGATRLC